MSKSSVTPSTDEFDAEFERVLQQRMLKRQNDLDKIISPQAGLWMALAPGWTPPLARSCGFPDLSEDGETLFEQMLSQKMVDVYPLQGADQQPLKYYEMVPNSRAEILQRYLSNQSEYAASQQRPNRLLEQVMKKAQKQPSAPRSPAEELVDLTAEIGERMHKAGLSYPGILPQLLSDWSRLASRANNPTALIDLFNAEVQAAFDQRKIGPIINRLEKARPLAALLEYALRPELSVAIDQAGRRIELLKRQANDFRHLSSFLRREEQVRVVMDMMNGPDEYWALHFIGAGGVGKTMIIRYITCLLTGGKDAPCLQDEMPFKEPVAVARIDFDYLNPDYPRLRPGLLLWSLAQELRPYDQSGGRANALFDEANRLLDELHALVANTGLAPGERASRHPIFIDAMMKYIDALKILGPRVLLILDTCEELSKASPEDEPNRNVSETLDILRALHDGAGILSGDANQSSSGTGLNTMRMICSGRRLLAGSGPGWKAPASNRLPPCSFLRIHEIRGFPYPEAEGFLRRSKVPETLIPAVVQASSPDPRGNIVIAWENPADKPADVPRCSPYQLHLYMDWAREVPPPQPTALTGAAEGHYVELRILQRLNDANLVRLLPVVSLLGHFDRDSLYAGVGGNAQDFDPAFDALQEQDWISSRLVSTGQDADGQEAARRRVLDVESSIRDHMRVYFERRGQILPAARRRAASFLQQRTLEDPLESLEWTDYDASLRASEADPEQAVAWWQRLETRLFDAYLAEKQNPEALHTLLQTLSGRDGACGMRDPQAGSEIPPENRLRPFVLAALAAVQQFMPEPARRRDTWRQVEEIVMRQAGADGTIPLDAGAHRLLRLALAGQVAAAHDPGSDLDAGLVTRFLAALERADLHDSQELAAQAAAFEALVERAERREEPGQPANTISSHLARITAQLPADPEVSRLYTWSFSLQGRAYRLDQALEPALAALKTSLLEINEKDTPFSYRYWKQPADLAARLRLEFIRAAFPLLLSPIEILQTIPIRVEIPRNSDQENLLAISIHTFSCARAPGGSELDAWLKSQGETFGCTCNAHRETPPLLVMLAEALAAGRVDEAMRKLEETRFRDYDARLWVARARVELSLRMRQWTYGQADANLLLEASRPEEVALLLRASAVEGRPHNVIPGTLDPHRLWQVDSPPADPGRLAEWTAGWNQQLTAALAAAQGVLALEALQLDLVELDKIAQTAGLRFDRSDSGQRWSPGDWGQRIESAMAAPVAGLRLVLRLRELVLPRPAAVEKRGIISGYGTPESFDSTQLDYLTTNLTARLGERQSAEIALEEAELLSLRLPGAETIWSAADERFKAAGDTGGEFRTLVGQLVHLTASAESLQAAKQVGQLPVFKRCEEVYAVLPDAHSLDEMDRYYSGGSPESKLLVFLKPPAWVPWQAYWAAVRTIVRGADLTPLRLEIESTYGRSSGDRIQLPREWEQLFRFAVSPASSSQDSQAVPASTARSQPRSYLILIVIFSLAFTAALLVGGFFLFRLTTQSIMGSVSTGTQVWIYFGVLLGIIFLVQVFRILRAWWNTLGFYELEIRPAQDQSKESSRSAAPMRLRLSRWAPRIFPLPPRLRYAAIAEDQLLASSGSTASRLSENIKERIFGKALVKAVAPQRASIPVTLRLQLSADTAAPAWEAVWAQVIRGDEAKPSRLKMRFIRVLQNSRTSPGDTQSETGRPAVGALSPGPAAQQVLNQAWSEQGKRGAVSVYVVSDIRAPQNQIQILHIIARVENQLGGPVLNLSSTDSSPSNIGRETLHKTSDWLNPGQLISLFPGMKLCLLQGDPVAFLETYAESSILSAEQTRRFAADLAAEGITVLVLPPVPPRLAANLGTRLAWVAPAFSRRGSAALVDVLRELQNRIHSGIENKTTGWSLALDACLYANDLPNPSFGEEMSKKMDPFEASMLEQKAKKSKP